MSRRLVPRLNYSLRSLLLLVTLCAVACGWLAWGIRDRQEQSLLVRRLEARGYRFTYVSLESKNSFSPVAWLGLLNPELCAHVTSARFANGSPTPDDMRMLSRFPHLCHVVLQNSLLTPECLAELGQLTQLVVVDLSDSQLPTGGELRHLERLPSLAMLHLSGTKLTDADVVPIRDFNALISLDLSECPVADQCAEVLATIPGLRRLDLRNTRISDAGVARLAEIRDLHHLDVSRSYVSNQQLADLRVRRPAMFLAPQPLQSPPVGVASSRGAAGETASNPMADPPPTKAG